MLKINNNFKNRTGNSSHNFANRLWCASAHREQAEAAQLATFAIRTRRSLDKSLYSKITGWSLAILAACGAFSYLTFIPEQAFAAYDWEQRTLSDIDTMQEMNAKICENSEIGESKQLEDARDRVNGQAGTGKKYWVTKLKGDTAGTKENGECWMTQNLAYSGTEEDNIGHPCTLSGLTDGSNCSDWVDSLADKYFAIGEHRENHGSRGNYYNWQAAVQNSSGGTGIRGVCPSGWQLPDRSRTKSFNNLIDAYAVSGTTNRDEFMYDPLYFRYSGRISSGSLNGVSTVGDCWTSISAGNSAYYLSFNSTDVYPSGYGNARSIGFPVRCVAADIYPEKPPITDNDTANVAITVSPVISIDVTKHANDMTVDFTKVATSTIVARVGSNQPYKVMLSTDKSDLTNPSTDKTIPMIPSDQTIVKGTSNWGIKKLSSPTNTTVNDSTIYSPVGINGEKALFYTSDSAASEDFTFPVAIAVDSSLPSGQYSTQVTLTAVAM